MNRFPVLEPVWNRNRYRFYLPIGENRDQNRNRLEADPC